LINPSPSSEIILNADGSIYHLGLRPEHLTDIVLTVGDPERVPAVSRYFDRIDARISKREFVTHVGEIGGRRIMVISSGIGTDNVEILLTELHILANFDLQHLLPKADARSLKIIRIGTSGAIQEDVPLDSLLCSDYAFGLDTLMQFYEAPGTEEEKMYADALKSHCQLGFPPYCARADASLLKHFADVMLTGNTVTCPGFYAPQGRRISLPIKPPFLMEQLRNFTFQGNRLTNFEMETAGYYALGAALGHQMLSTNAIMANRASGQFSNKPAETVDRLIRTVIDKILVLDSL
jgi:uridine phosphorylase